MFKIDSKPSSSSFEPGIEIMKSFRNNITIINWQRSLNFTADLF